MTLTPSDIVLIFLMSKPLFILGTVILVGLGAKSPTPQSVAATDRQLEGRKPRLLEGTNQET